MPIHQLISKCYEKTNLIDYFFRYRKIVENCSTVKEAITLWEKEDETSRTLGGFNTAVSQPYTKEMKIPLQSRLKAIATVLRFEGLWISNPMIHTL